MQYLKADIPLFLCIISFMSKKDLIIITLTVLILSVIIFHPVITGKLIQDGDLNDSHIPIKQSIKNNILKFRMPVTEKGSGLGFPIYRDTHNGIWNPANVFLLLPLNIYIITYIMIIAGLFIMGAGSYILMFYLTADRYKALYITVIMCAGSFTLSRIGHYSIIASLSFIPLYFYFVLQLLRTERKMYSLLTAITLFCILAGGHPQVFLAVMIATVIIKGKNIVRSPFVLRTYVLTFLMTSVLWIPLMIQASLTQRLIKGITYSMDFKQLLYTVFPTLHFSYKFGIPQVYKGIYNIYEISAYQGILALIIIFHAVYNWIVHVKRVKKITITKTTIAGLLLILMSFLDFTGFRIFNTPVRYFGMGFALIVFESIRCFDIRTVKRKSIAIFILISIFSLIILTTRAFPLIPVIETLSLIIVFSIIIIFVRKKALWPILIILTACELLFFALPLYRWESSEMVINKKYDFLKEKRIVTYLPKYYELHIDNILGKYPNENVESVKRFSSFGERGIYYNAYSYNQYSTTAFHEYVNYFNDSLILNGGFSDIAYLLDPGDMYFDYVFVPDMPVIIDIKDSLTLINSEKTQYALFYMSEGLIADGNKNVGKDTLIGPFNTYVSTSNTDSVHITGNGILFMIKDREGSIIRFPEYFETNGFTRITQEAYSLMKAPSFESGDIFIIDPSSGILKDKRDIHFIPIDLIIGIIISITALLLLLILPVNKKSVFSIRNKNNIIES